MKVTTPPEDETPRRKRGSIVREHERTVDFLAESPTGATLQAEMQMKNGRKEAIIIATVHIVGNACACNLWHNIDYTWTRMMPERVLITTNLSTYMLQGELNRFSSTHGSAQLGRNKDLRMTIQELQAKITESFLPLKQP